MKQFMLPLLMIGVLILTGCKKENETEETPEPDKEYKITANLLHGDKGGNLRIWYVVDVQKRFYNAQDKLDSTFKAKLLRPMDAYLAFLRNDDDDSNGILDNVETYTAMEHILEVEGGGYWLLNNKADTLTITTYINSNLPYDFGTRVVRNFQIKPAKLATALGTYYDYGIEASCTTNLANGRKLVEAFSIGALN